MKHGKKYVDASRRYDRAALHQPTEAFGLVKQLANRKIEDLLGYTMEETREFAMKALERRLKVIGLAPVPAS